MSYTIQRMLKRARVPQFLLSAVKKITGNQPILLDFPVNPTPRYGYGKPPHPKLYEIINRNRNAYKNTLGNFLRFKENFLNIPLKNENNTKDPSWVNEFFTGLDAVTLYSLLCLNNPKRLVEIGSGYSTQFARRAIIDHSLKTKITSIDPHPRAGIDLICDTVIRQPLEDMDLSLFDELEAGDFLFVDGSHRCFTNSDVTVVFLEVLPRLRNGVLVEFHDIFLPYDYIPEWSERYYSEQYLLAVHILSENNKFNIIFPALFISKDAELNKILNPLWNDPRMELKELEVLFGYR